MKLLTSDSVSRRSLTAMLISLALTVPALAQDFAAGEPIGANNEAGQWQPMSDNVKVPSVPSVPTTDGVWVEVMAYDASCPNTVKWNL